MITSIRKELLKNMSANKADKVIQDCLVDLKTRIKENKDTSSIRQEYFGLDNRFTFFLIHHLMKEMHETIT